MNFLCVVYSFRKMLNKMPLVDFTEWQTNIAGPLVHIGGSAPANGAGLLFRMDIDWSENVFSMVILLSTHL